MLACRVAGYERLFTDTRARFGRSTKGATRPARQKLIRFSLSKFECVPVLKARRSDLDAICRKLECPAVPCLPRPRGKHGRSPPRPLKMLLVSVGHACVCVGGPYDGSRSAG